jgi:Tol biopolymer transport system component/DNA-binding winged helix-turn-helix (wHTH) protein
MSSNLREGFQLGSMRVDPQLGTITMPNGEVRHVEPKVMDVLVILAEHANKLVSDDQLLEAVGTGHVASNELLTEIINELQRALEHEPVAPTFIVTVEKEGYRLIGEVGVAGESTLTDTNHGLSPTTRRFAIGITGLAVVLLAAVVINESGYLETRDQIETDYRKLSDSTIAATGRTPRPIIADESQLYFSHILNGDFAVSQLPQTGGEPVPIVLPFTDDDSISVLVGITPDKSELLFENYPKAKQGNLSNELWTVPINRASSRRLGRGGGGVFSPSGDQLLFSEHRTNLTIANPDMTERREIVKAQNRIFWPRFSPDGTTVRFSQSSDLAADGSSLWEVKLDGSQPFELLPDSNLKSSCCGSWTPDGKVYVFQASTDDGTHLWAIKYPESGEIESSKPFQITSGTMDFSSPTISSDGETIFAFGGQKRGEIAEFDSTTKSFKAVAGLESMSVDQVSYSLDQQSVVYVSYPDSSLWRKNLSDGNELQLTFPPMRVRDPRWSPDGETIAFDGLVPGQRTRIYTVAADGGPLILASDPACSSSSASWSGTGTYIVFDDWCSDSIRTYNPDTGELGNLPGSDGLQWPNWSPDGKNLAALSGNDIVFFDPSDGSVQALFDSDLRPRFFHYSWSADSSGLFFIEAQNRNPQRFVHRFDVEEKTITKVAQIGHERSASGIRGHWVGISLNGNPLMLRDQSINNIYALEWNPD